MTILDRIVAHHRRAAAADTRLLGPLVAAAASGPAPRAFRTQLTVSRPGGVVVIAEMKRRSPSRGGLAPGLVPAELARAYEAGGAGCLSVLTDSEDFGGSPADLVEARAACGLPVLRKDFTVDERDVCDARLMGADAVLLIVRALSDPELNRFRRLAAELGLAALVEVHDDADLDRALGANADLVGVNQRDLETFAVDPDRAEKLAERLPPSVVKVAESGIRSAADVARLASAGYDAILVGETLVTAADPAAALRSLLPAT